MKIWMPLFALITFIGSVLILGWLYYSGIFSFTVNILYIVLVVGSIISLPYVLVKKWREKTFQSGHAAGFEAGYEQGHKDGSHEVFEVAYSRGRELGKAEGKEINMGNK